MSEEACGLFQVVGQVGGERSAYGVGVGVPFEPGGDGGGQAADVVPAQEKPGLVAAQAGEEVGGRAVALQVVGLRLGERRAWARGRRWRRQLERLLELSALRHVEIQVMPTETEEHAGLGGSHQVLS